MRFKTIEDIASWRLCLGCGACSYICDEGRIRLVDLPEYGIRPFLTDGECDGCGDCVKVCPGIDASHASIPENRPENPVEELKEGWGTVLEVWEGHAADAEIRYQGSSGGAATAIALYCLENEGMHGVLHTGSDENEPWRNRTALSRDKKSLISRTGSRYSPASPCEGLTRIEAAPDPCVFIGKPCDITGLRKAETLRPMLKKNNGLAIGIFCAGTPSTAGTLALLEKFGASPSDIQDIRYRGMGWPGSWAAALKGGTERFELPYRDAWGFLQKYRPFRCYLCPDGTSEFADISCGDPWYRAAGVNEPGSSLVLVRTERGREILRRAIETRYLTLKRVEPSLLKKSQENLLHKRKTVWGRVLALRLFGVPSPRLAGYSLFRNWRDLSAGEKFMSLAGTARRILTRGYYKRSRAIRLARENLKHNQSPERKVFNED